VVRLLVILLLLAAFCLGAAISYHNWSAVPFHYLAGRTELPLIALLLGAFLLGAMVIGLLDVGRLWAMRRESRRLQRRLQDAEAELKTLRNLPLQSGTPGSAPPSTLNDA